ncbi:MAG: hypothetical protein HY960_13865 [Ignavibacteriae bacterium]|nr:hypothetical protein [Ignavibacteriota bacterium]
MFYKEVVHALNIAGVRYLIVGGVAVNLHGIPRMTYDIDIMIDFDTENVLRALQVLKSMNFIPRLPVNAEEFAREEIRHLWKREKNMLVFSFFLTEKQFETIDIFVEHPLNFKECYKHREDILFEGVTYPTISRDDLILLKEKADRTIDQSDIEALQQLKRVDGKA